MGGTRLDTVLTHASAAGLDGCRLKATAHDSITSEVGERVEMRAGVPAHDDQLVGRAEAAGAHGVTMPSLQGEDVGRMRRVHGHAHREGRAQVKDSPTHD